MSDDLRDIGTKFEAKKIGMRHTKDGHVFYMACHPDDTPADLMQDPLGQRYVMVAVRLNDHDEPVPSKAHDDGTVAVKVAAALCRDEKFQGWLCLNGLADEVGEEAAAIAIREYCKITSRSELKTNLEARQRFSGLRDEFQASLR